jgi:hypothetical protein
MSSGSWVMCLKKDMKTIKRDFPLLLLLLFLRGSLIVESVNVQKKIIFYERAEIKWKARFPHSISEYILFLISFLLQT